MNYIFTHHCQ